MGIGIRGRKLDSLRVKLGRGGGDIEEDRRTCIQIKTEYHSISTLSHLFTYQSRYEIS